MFHLTPAGRAGMGHSPLSAVVCQCWDAVWSFAEISFGRKIGEIMLQWCWLISFWHFPKEMLQIPILKKLQSVLYCFIVPNKIRTKCLDFGWPFWSHMISLKYGRGRRVKCWWGGVALNCKEGKKSQRWISCSCHLTVFLLLISLRPNVQA